MFQESIIRLTDRCTRIFRHSLKIGFVLSIVFTGGCGGLVSHKVESGDSLYSIGFYYGHDYRDIAKWNNIPPPYVINKGQWLRVAPPDEKWWEEQRAALEQEQGKSKKRRADSGKYPEKNQSGSSGSSGSIVSKTGESIKSVKQTNKKVIAEDFTDKTGRINSWAWPTEGRLLNANEKFSQRNKGIDISGRRGQLVFATASGKVVYSGSGLIGYGKLIIIKHNKTYLSAYAHNEKILVKEGDIVKRSQKIAHMGRTPDNHIQLHFEIRRNGKPVDPLRFLKR